MVIKIKEISIGGGGKISRNFQSVPYPCKVTVTGEDGDKPSKMIEKAIKLLIVVVDNARENAEKELDLLIKMKEDSEMGFIVRNDINKPSKALPEITIETLDIKQTSSSPMTHFKDLKNSTIMAESESGLAYQVVKDGYFTWLAKSHIDEGIMPLPLGVLIQEIHLKNERKWILGKDKAGNPKLEWQVVGG